MLSKKNRLEAKNFRITYQKGKKFRGKYGMLIVDDSIKSQTTKFGFVVSKKIGNAIKRNRMTRLLRSIAYSALKEMELDKYGLNMEYVAFEFCNDQNVLKEEMYEQIRKAISN